MCEVPLGDRRAREVARETASEDPKRSGSDRVFDVAGITEHPEAPPAV